MGKGITCSSVLGCHSTDGVGGLVGVREGSEGKGITPSLVSEWHSTCGVTISLPAWVGFLCRERTKGSVEVLHQCQGSRIKEEGEISY